MAGQGLINDLENELVAADGANTIVPQVMAVASSPLSGAAVDLQDADGSCWAFLHVGAVSTGTTAPTADVKLQESDTSGGTYADISGAAFAQVTTASHFKVLTFKRTKRFVRALATMTGTVSTVAMACSIVGQKKNI